MTDSPQTELHWYVAKTFRRERKIKERLEILGIEHFIPFHKVVKQFGARRVAVEEPIVNGIIFIRYDFRGSIALSQRLRFRNEIPA
ncbi:MAG: transcription termination/antitermination NusG family protein [Alistipes indistinctus]